ncbi:hypothetical protein J6590_052705 [Homalodisca vitripennis]|nr:hypothetical protein J6590_052705 [Homalodisca vitripennis]
MKTVRADFSLNTYLTFNLPPHNAKDSRELLAVLTAPTPPPPPRRLPRLGSSQSNQTFNVIISSPWNVDRVSCKPRIS